MDTKPNVGLATQIFRRESHEFSQMANCKLETQDNGGN